MAVAASYFRLGHIYLVLNAIGGYFDPAFQQRKLPDYLTVKNEVWASIGL